MNYDKNKVDNSKPDY